MSDKRPELPELKVGDQIIALYCGHNRRHMRDEHKRRELTIVRIARKYLYAVETTETGRPYAREEAYDKKDQHEKSGNYSAEWRFVTAEQEAWEGQRDQAREFLTEALGRDAALYLSRGRYGDDEVTLANLIRRHEGLPDL